MGNSRDEMVSVWSRMSFSIRAGTTHGREEVSSHKILWNRYFKLELCFDLWNEWFECILTCVHNFSDLPDHSVLSAFTDPKIVKPLVIMTYMWVTDFIVYNGLSLTSTTLAVSFHSLFYVVQYSSSRWEILIGITQRVDWWRSPLRSSFLYWWTCMELMNGLDDNSYLQNRKKAFSHSHSCSHWYNSRNTPIHSS